MPENQEYNMYCGIEDLKKLCDEQGVFTVMHYIKKTYPDLYVSIADSIADSIDVVRCGSREEYFDTFIRGSNH